VSTRKIAYLAPDYFVKLKILFLFFFYDFKKREKKVLSLKVKIMFVRSDLNKSQKRSRKAEYIELPKQLLIVSKYQTTH